MLLAEVARLGLEGVIAKRRNSRYEPGARGGAWLKVKVVREQEMVIGGYTDPGGTRKYFGALILGYYERGKLLYAGKVGTGFGTALLRALHEKFQGLVSATCPFDNLPEPRGHRYGTALTASEMKRCHWLRPELVCQVKFAEWTSDHRLRQPVFIGLREDKPPKDVVREWVVTP